jgi:aryl-alcohol dehydrogenase-like predicted oxidoreductase
MHYRPLGRTGIKVSPYALGALMFATSIGNPDHDDSIRIIHKALDAGINLIDTADSYGDSEEVVGKALKGRRDSVVLATKFSRPMGDDPNRQGTSRRWIMTAVRTRCAACRPTTSTSTRSTYRTPPPTSRRRSPRSRT